jgi:solute carrier family 45, member 1/2/4
VIPQFIVTGLSAVIFALFDHPTPIHAKPGNPGVVPHPPPPSGGIREDENKVEELIRLVRRSVEAGGGSNSVVYVFRYALPFPLESAMRCLTNFWTYTG